MVEDMVHDWCAPQQDFGIGKLRSTAPDASARLAQALGFPAPDARRMTGNRDLACLRLGPQEWLIVGNESGVAAALRRIADAFAGELALLLEMSHGGHVLRLTGVRSIDCIAAFCEIDLRPAAFPAGSATRTRFGDIAVTLARLDDQPSFWLIADQSHADYLRLLIHRDAAEPI